MALTPKRPSLHASVTVHSHHWTSAMKKCSWSGTRKLLFNRRSFTSVPILRSGSYASVLLGSAMVFYKTFYQHRHDAVASIIQTGCFEGFVCPFPVQSAVLPGSWTTGCLSFWMPGGRGIQHMASSCHQLQVSSL
ncbi:hypothetical protein V1264_001626 [Littorina saxatilis]|uniref:Uncharacterized protein n=1 Tax=Littorina saxatilis TaxID=31220 RepID=A0AAN9GR40_9CAEN